MRYMGHTIELCGATFSCVHALSDYYIDGYNPNEWDYGTFIDGVGYIVMKVVPYVNKVVVGRIS